MRNGTYIKQTPAVTVYPTALHMRCEYWARPHPHTFHFPSGEFPVCPGTSKLRSLCWTHSRQQTFYSCFVFKIGHLNFTPYSFGPSVEKQDTSGHAKRRAKFGYKDKEETFEAVVKIFCNRRMRGITRQNCYCSNLPRWAFTTSMYLEFLFPFSGPGNLEWEN